MIQQPLDLQQGQVSVSGINIFMNLSKIFFDEIFILDILMNSEFFLIIINVLVLNCASMNVLTLNCVSMKCACA